MSQSLPKLGALVQLKDHVNTIGITTYIGRTGFTLYSLETDKEYHLSYRFSTFYVVDYHPYTLHTLADVKSAYPEFFI